MTLLPRLTLVLALAASCMAQQVSVGPPCTIEDIVPDLLGQTGPDAIAKWHESGFTGAIIFNRWGDGLHVVSQSLTAGDWQCRVEPIGVIMQ